MNEKIFCVNCGKEIMHSEKYWYHIGNHGLNFRSCDRKFHSTGPVASPNINNKEGLVIDKQIIIGWCAYA